MINSIKAKKNNIKTITFLIDLTTPLLLFLSLESGKSPLIAFLFSAMVLIKVIFVLV